MLFQLRNLVTKEFIQLFRDRLLAPFILLGPLAELLLIAWSTSQGIDHLPTAVLDMDRTSASRGLVVAMENTETFDPYYVESLDQGTYDIDRGRALAAWVIPPGFQRQLRDADASRPQLQLVVDGADVAAAQTAAVAGEGVAASYGNSFAVETQNLATGEAVPLEVSLRVWFNEELKESNFMIPSELGFIAAAIAAMLASMIIARERELGTLEQLIVTPIKPSQIVIGKSIMAVSLGFILFCLMLGMVVWFFDVPMRGSVPLLLVLAFF